MILFDHDCLRSAHVGPLNTLRTLAPGAFSFIYDVFVKFGTMAVEIQLRKQERIERVSTYASYSPSAPATFLKSMDSGEH